MNNRGGTKIADNSNAASSRPNTRLQTSKPASLTVPGLTKSTNADIMNAVIDFRAEFLSASKAQSDASSSQFRELKGEFGYLKLLRWNQKTAYYGTRLIFLNEKSLISNPLDRYFYSSSLQEASER